MTVIPQVLPIANVAPQVVVSAKFVALAPLRPMLVRLSVALPELVTVTVCAALVDSAGVVKLSWELLKVMAAPVTAPFSVMACGAPLALSASERLALYVPTVVPLNPTLKLQEAPAANVVQLLVWLKLLAFVPPIDTPVTLNGALPEFVSRTCWVAAVVP